MSNAHQLSSQAKAAVALKAQTITADASGAGVDTTGYDRVTFQVNVGTVTGTSPTLDITLQESSDDGGSDAYANVTSGTITQITDSNDESIYLLEVNAAKRERYLRLDFNTGGTSPSYPISATAWLHRARHEAPSQLKTVASV